MTEVTACPIRTWVIAADRSRRDPVCFDARMDCGSGVLPL